MYVYKNKVNRRKRFMSIFFTFIVAASGSYLAQTYLSYRFGNEKNIERLSNNYMREDEIVLKSNYLKSRADVIEECMKSVVGISMLKPNDESLFDTLLTEKWGLGTGIVVSEDGYILTNQHLARKTNTKLIVNLEDGESVQGTVKWCDKNIDLALIKIDKENLIPAKLGDSDKIRIGDEVLAIGNPLGVEFQRSTTRGIISGINRTLTFEEDNETIFMEDLIQTDASINSGNSGGPLINESGEVIGINTVKITTAEGMGFAVPINIIIPIINKIVESSKFVEAYLGIYAYDKEIVKYVKSNINIDRGIYLTNIVKDGPADESGLKVGDIIMSIDGIQIDKVTDLRRYIYSKEPGDTINILISRNNKIESVRVKLSGK